MKLSYRMKLSPSLEQKNNELRPKDGTYNTEGDYLVLGCVHAPAYNRVIMGGIMEMAYNHSKEFVGLVILGDFIDCYSLSSHSVGSTPPIPGLDLSREYLSGNYLLDQLLQPLTSLQHKIYLYGNHENRYNKYMGNAEQSKRPVMSPEEGLDLEERGFDVYTDYINDSILLGDHLQLIHGQYLNTHTAKKHIDQYRSSVMFAHTHKIQSYIEGHVGGFNIGWLGDVTSPLFNYAQRGTKLQWQNGFAVVHIDNNRDYYVTQVVCHNNKFRYNNQMYG